MKPAARTGRWIPGGLLRLMYGASTTLDVTAPLILIRRDATPALLEQSAEGDDAIGVDLLLAACRAGLEIVQIPILAGTAAAETPEATARLIARALRLTIVARIADLLETRRQVAAAGAGARPRS
jgi:hypothetical protein